MGMPTGRMMSSPSNTTKWMSYLAEGLLPEEEEVQSSNPFCWCINQQVDCGIVNECLKGESDVPEKSCSKKRSREETCSGASKYKACREKMRRDRLNDRFMELSAILELSRTPKIYKATILSDVVRILTQLRTEAEGLQESNNQLRETIKNLKNEKNEVREEKTWLKADKRRLEQQVKAMTVPSRYMPHHAVMHAAAVAYAAQTQPASTKATQMAAYPGMAMWQWMPPAVVDTSQDHALRPPVA